MCFTVYNSIDTKNIVKCFLCCFTESVLDGPGAEYLISFKNGPPGNTRTQRESKL